MNNILLIIGMIALSNGNISLGDFPLFDNKNKTQIQGTKKEKSSDKRKKSKKDKLSQNKDTKETENLFRFTMDDINKGIKLMDFSEEDLERGMEIITRTKKYMSPDEKKVLVKVESVLDLVRGIKKLSTLDNMEEDETNFFRSMDDEDKKNMMIKEILDVFPERKKQSIDKALDMKKKIDLFAELFLPDDLGEGGFSISSLANLSNLGSMGNLKLLGSLLRVDDQHDKDEEYVDVDDDLYEGIEFYEDEEYDEKAGDKV